MSAPHRATNACASASKMRRTRLCVARDEARECATDCIKDSISSGRAHRSDIPAKSTTTKAPIIAMKAMTTKISIKVKARRPVPYRPNLFIEAATHSDSPTGSW